MLVQLLTATPLCCTAAVPQVLTLAGPCCPWSRVTCWGAFPLSVLLPQASLLPLVRAGSQECCFLLKELSWIWRVTECVKIYSQCGTAAFSSLSHQHGLSVGVVAQAICRAGGLERAPVGKR